jgi:Ca-activated chloride channel family protein
VIQGNIDWLTPLYSLVPLGFALIAVSLMLRRSYLYSLDFPSHRNTESFKHPLLALIPITVKEYASSSKKIAIIQSVVLIWLVLMLALSAAQPVKIGKKLPDLPPERDIILLVDVSISMTLDDYREGDNKVSRLAVLKRVLHDFSNASTGERLGMIIFAEQPYVLVPLSRDQHLIQAQLQRLHTSLAGRVSALGDAITLGLKEAAKQPQRKQIIVIFTDVNDSIGRVTPDAAAILAQEAQIPLYTIAIGSAQKKREDVNGGLLYQAVNIALLEQISQTTGGKSYIATETQAIEQALQDIQTRQANSAIQKPRYAHEALYNWFLLAGIIPLILWQLIRLWQSRRGQSNSI